MKLDEIEALARDGETDAASVLALIAVVRAADAMRAEEYNALLYAKYDAARAQLEQSP